MLSMRLDDKRLRTRCLAVMLLVLSGLMLSACASQPQFKGRDFSYGTASDFRLPDQDGQIISVSEQGGKVIVLSFMYTNCRDVCPLTAVKFSTVYDQLGSLASQVASASSVRLTRVGRTRILLILKF